MITEPYCSHCGTHIDSESARPGRTPQSVECPTCLQDVRTAKPRPEPARAEAAPPSSDSPAWEGEGGIIGSLWKTCWQVMLRPARTLGAPLKDPLIWALSFGAIIGTIGEVGMVLIESLLGWMSIDNWRDYLGILISPLLIILVLLIYTAVVHFCLWVVRGAKKGYRASLKVVGYSQAPSLWMMLPWIGLPLALIWNFYIMVAGLAAVHGTSRLRVFIAIIIPIILIFFLILGLILVFGIGMIQQMMQNQGMEQLWKL